MGRGQGRDTVTRNKATCTVYMLFEQSRYMYTCTYMYACTYMYTYTCICIHVHVPVQSYTASPHSWLDVCMSPAAVVQTELKRLWMRYCAWLKTRRGGGVGWSTLRGTGRKIPQPVQSKGNEYMYIHVCVSNMEVQCKHVNIV